jgi:hypothetical protein
VRCSRKHRTAEPHTRRASRVDLSPLPLGEVKFAGASEGRGENSDPLALRSLIITQKARWVTYIRSYGRIEKLLWDR